MTVAEYYRMRLTQPQLVTTPPSWADYLHVSDGALYAALGASSNSPPAPHPQTYPFVALR